MNYVQLSDDDQMWVKYKE
jgi:DNA primase large subunit